MAIDIAGVRGVVELAGERGMGGQGRRQGVSEGLEDGVEGWQMVALEEQEVLQQRNQNPLCLHGVELDARLRRQRASAVT